ncbi:hypothetical protein LHA31_00445 [Carnobacterium viridans]|uniref:Uncharacterized protein n=1 Tax=Carnobacterium viridans TaxID=174587 RepID=A0A1H0Y6P3_9LACT|nr:hypothetical protein [Carnobacterium viridans]UDE95317.1 hypothetical protein LHA31_00445 [Carnobacterium viridans]SDQ10844.1 hypothetical protein SAMN04487752_0738 [Carnobacterium viridans]
MNQGFVKDLTSEEQTELQSLANIIFVETIAKGFYELKKVTVTLPEGFPLGRIYSREMLGKLLLDEHRYSILIETNDSKYLYQSSTVKIPKIDLPHLEKEQIS